MPSFESQDRRKYEIQAVLGYLKDAMAVKPDGVPVGEWLIAWSLQEILLAMHGGGESAGELLDEIRADLSAIDDCRQVLEEIRDRMPEE